MKVYGKLYKEEIEYNLRKIILFDSKQILEK